MSTEAKSICTRRIRRAGGHDVQARREGWVALRVGGSASLLQHFHIMHALPTTALITGAASGLGRQVALQLARQGWTIAGLDVNEAPLAQLVEELRRDRRNAFAVVADVTDAPTLGAQVARVENELGPIDLLVACAGIAEETPALAMDVVQIDKIIRINLLGVTNVLAAVLPHMAARRRGHLVAVSSLASLQSLPHMMGYCASKAGLDALMESVRLDVSKHGIHVTTVCPGWTRTPQTEGRYRLDWLLSAEESAAQIVWAIGRRKRFHAYPRKLVWQMRLMRLLPQKLYDWLLCRRLSELRTDQKPVCAG